MKIIAVGMNYASHNREMNHAHTMENPVIFIKADTAILKNGKPFFIPDIPGEIHYEAEIVVRIDRLGKNIEERFASRYYNEITVGIDLTARDLQKELREKGLPWEISKSFDNSAVIGTFIPLADIGGDVQDIPFHLNINNRTVQSGNTGEMIFNVNRIISYASRFFTLRTGDLIYTGTPQGVGAIKIDDHLEGFVGDRKLLDFNIK
jgi:2-keto-4-pentenoate hydratase/2-oxohepta-3-ene-1,7-dioic acid hydratase in catechol pathway